MTEETVRRLWLYEQGELKQKEVVELFRTLFFTGDIWRVHNLQYPHHYLAQAATFFEQGFFNNGRGE